MAMIDLDCIDKEIDFSYEAISVSIERGKRYLLFIPLKNGSYYPVWAEDTGGKLPTLYDFQEDDLYALYNEDVDMSKKLKIIISANKVLDNKNRRENDKLEN